MGRTTKDAKANDTGGDEVDHDSPLSGEAFLTVNRKKRAQAKEEADREAARKARVPGKVETPKRSWRSVAGGGSRRLVTVLAALVVALGATSVGLGIWALHSSNVAAQTDPASRHGQDAMKTAREYVSSVMTYDVKDYGALDRKIREIATTDFAEEFIKSSADARKGNTAAGASSEATAANAGIIALSGDKAEVLVTLDQKISAPGLAEALPEGYHLYQSRVKVTLVRDGDRWLLDDLQVV
ncbi:hypothetical protein GOARA_026_00110 [Gordonia araii NBRC 100433]|uniref:Mce-associated membrane protein n=1 Tax=Gordonia araii NBRC 100433 TaxID=1073574 RepID=G7GZF7_9ACTN|nr:hypothetical protein [Gordonia araii]NNG97946.1 hypothetical protein [Gordonia araii NBRC 100433]GAB08982.1 hypothetical protein GOARA_026_00110 [Gordonia araii NBRC 100433]